MPETKKNIVIAGGGFGGILAAVYLDKGLKKNPAIAKNYQLILINNHHLHLYTPALYEIASIPQGKHNLEYVKSSITIPLIEIFEHRNVEWREETIISIDRTKKELAFQSGKALPYEYLILALGSETSYFNIPGAKEHGLPLKTFADAVHLRDAIENGLMSGTSHLDIVVAGAGASGVEVAAEFENFVSSIQKIGQACQVTVSLVEGSPEILPGFDAWVVQKAKKRLESLGVKIITNALITQVDKTMIRFKNGSTRPYTILVWAGGVKAASVLASMGIQLSPKGGAPINQFLEVGRSIFAVGDSAAFIHPKTGKPLPWNVPIAEAQAKTAAANIIREISGKPKLPFRPKIKYPFILAVGETYAIADLNLFHLAGFSAWILKQAIELKYLLTILPFFQAIPTWLKFMAVARSNDVRMSTKTQSPQAN
ncbi:MAG: NAD(P)/FAD-dependent oxidoreductase [Candidatus Sungbacteria bacterium]|uniref:NAD(P)/FAD-dependent oxidoreductase n=1 Tax=Candidatus Sungiibacteriota bacterium TaxID=2750080 RepID=A0A9D6QTT5_9BACT|nr:NAD(P)/FAD-dependent oxidoreductase [Candidatus Sungbacteria bacterium]